MAASSDAGAVTTDPASVYATLKLDRSQVDEERNVERLPMLAGRTAVRTQRAFRTTLNPHHSWQNFHGFGVAIGCYGDGAT